MLYDLECDYGIAISSTQQCNVNLANRAVDPQATLTML